MHRPNKATKSDIEPFKKRFERKKVGSRYITNFKEYFDLFYEQTSSLGVPSYAFG